MAVRAGLACMVSGPVVGLLWWLTSPGGLRSPGDSYLELLQASGAAEAALALWCLAAGAVAGIWWVLAREEVHDARAVGRLVGVLSGGLLGAVLAWGTGALLRRVLPVEVPEVPADVVADLLSPPPGLGVLAALLLWPLATGVLVVMDTLRDLAWQALLSDRRAGED